MYQCTTCGKDNSEIAKFCTGCGAALRNTISQQDSTTTSAVILKKKKRWLWPVVTISVLVSLSVSIYFIFFRHKKDLPIMMVLPENLKLRSSLLDVGEDNVLRSVSYGDSLKIIDSTNDWYKVEVEGQKGYMRSRYLAVPKDFYEADAILKSVGSSNLSGPEQITESRFKKSLLNFFRNHHYTAEIPQDIKEKYFKTTDSSVNEVWGIRPTSANAYTFLKGYFYSSNKKGLAILLQAKNSPSLRKLVFFNYDDNETEVNVSEFDQPLIENINIIGKNDIRNYGNIDNSYPKLDMVTSRIPGKNVVTDFYYTFRNGKMEEDVQGTYLDDYGE